VLDLQIQCLEGQRAVMDAFVGAVSSGTTPQLVRAAGAVLPEPASCRLSARSETRPLPADPQLRAQIAAVEQSVAMAHAAELLGDYPRGADIASKSVEAARKLDYQPVLASALVRLASVEAERAGNRPSEQPAGLDRAAALLAEAYAVAEAGHDDGQRLAAASEQIVVHNRRGQNAEALRWARLAQALLSRLGEPPSEAGVVAMSVGWVKLSQGERSEAAAAFSRSLEISQKIQPPDERRLAQVARSLCTTEPDEVKRIACFRHALAMARAAFGEQHPTLGRFYTNLSTCLNPFAATHSESCALLRKAVAVQEPSLDPANPSMILTLGELASCYEDDGNIAEAARVYADAVARRPGPADRAHLFEQYGMFLSNYGDPDAALRYLTASLADYQAVLGPTHRHTLRVRLDLALTHQDQGHLGEARRQIDEAVDFLRKNAPHDVRYASFLAEKGMDLRRQKKFPAAIRTLEEAQKIAVRFKDDEVDEYTSELGLGLTYLDVGRTDEASVHLERALALRPADLAYTPVTRAWVAFPLARALAAKGRDRERACALAGEAAAIYRKSTLQREKRLHLPEIERWLARHGC
jgi:tetratricopeptide (TPR) repeat protein